MSRAGSKKKAVIVVGMVLVAVTGAVAWRTLAPRGPTRAAVVEAVARDVAVPRFKAFATTTAELASTAASGCDDVEILRTKWRAARSAWKSAEVLAIGPLNDERLQGVVDFWPVRSWIIDEKLAGVSAFDGPGISALPSPARGFPALDYLLFGPPSAALEGRACDYVKGLTVDLAQRASKSGDQWSAGHAYLKGLVAAPQMAMDDFVNRLVSQAYSVEDMKLARPLGKRYGNMPQPEALESPYSRASVQDLVDDIGGIRAVYDALRPLVAAANPGAERRVREGLDTLRTTIEALKPDLTTVATSGAPEGTRAFEAAKTATRLLSTELVTALGVTLRFSDNDGD